MSGKAYQGKEYLSWVMKNEFVRWKKLRMKKRASIQGIASWEKKRKHWDWDAEREREIQYEPRKWKWKSLSHVQLIAIPWNIWPWNSPGQNTGVGGLSLLLGIFPTQVSRISGRFFTSWATREAQEWTQRGWQKGDQKKSYLKDSDLIAKEMKDN